MSIRALLVFACALLCFSCDGGTQVGLGRFRIIAARGANSCGPQSGLFNASATFDVELKVGNGTLRWTPSSGETATGSWSASLHAFRVVLEQDAVAIPPDRRTQFVGCTIRRTDIIEGTISFDDADASVTADASAQVDAGTTPVARSLTATETIVYGAVDGTDCRSLIGAGDGQLNAMPCNVTYALSGVRTGDVSATPAITF